MSPSKAPAPVAATAASRAASARRGRLAVAGDLGGAFHGAELGYEHRGVRERREAVEGGGEAAALGGGQAVGVPLDADAAAGEAELGEERSQVALGAASPASRQMRTSSMREVKRACSRSADAGEQHEPAVGGRTSAWKWT